MLCLHFAHVTVTTGVVIVIGIFVTHIAITGFPTGDQYCHMTGVVIGSCLCGIWTYIMLGVRFHQQQLIVAVT